MWQSVDVVPVDCTPKIFLVHRLIACYSNFTYCSFYNLQYGVDLGPNKGSLLLKVSVYPLALREFEPTKVPIR